MHTHAQVNDVRFDDQAMGADSSNELGNGAARERTIHTYIHTYIHTCMHTCIHTYMHTYIHTYIHICTYRCCPGEEEGGVARR